MDAPTTTAPDAGAGSGGGGAPARLVPIWMEILGWYGSAAIVGTYFASSHGHMSQGVLYQLLNVTGALGVGMVCWKRRTWQGLAIEVVWISIGLSALFELMTGSA